MVKRPDDLSLLSSTADTLFSGVDVAGSILDELTEMLNSDEDPGVPAHVLVMKIERLAPKVEKLQRAAANACYFEPGVRRAKYRKCRCLFCGAGRTYDSTRSRSAKLQSKALKAARKEKS